MIHPVPGRETAATRKTPCNPADPVADAHVGVNGARPAAPQRPMPQQQSRVQSVAERP
jgi:hypothetical protein